MDKQMIRTAFGSHLYPLGYRAPGADEVLADLMATQPHAYLFDVRYRARSRWFPQWNKRALRERWGERYIHEKRLGNVHYRSPELPIQLVDPFAGVRSAAEWLQEPTRLLVVLCGCVDYERCHRKVVVELLRQRCADVVRSDGMRFDLTSGLYVGMTADGAYSESVDPALFDLYRPVWGERVYDPVMWLGLSFQRTDGIWIQPLQSDEEGWL